MIDPVPFLLPILSFTTTQVLGEELAFHWNLICVFPDLRIKKKQNLGKIGANSLSVQLGFPQETAACLRAPAEPTVGQGNTLCDLG